MLSKSFTDLFIRKPVIALVVNIVILVVGVVSYFKLNWNGARLIEEDPLNMVSYVNGVDRLAERRALLGLF
jgi:hypothetical protein